MALSGDSNAGSTGMTDEPVDLTSSSPHSLYRALRARRSEYIRPHRIRVKIGTWNVAACPGTDKDLGSWFVQGQDIGTRLAKLESQPEAQQADDFLQREEVRQVGGDKIGLYVLGLQEIIGLNTANLTAYASDPAPREKWKAALEAALPQDYQLVVCEQLTGMLLMVYASPEIAPTISNAGTSAIGTGMPYGLGRLGNKGAVSTRIVLGESTRLVFVNCHLASGSDPSTFDRRIWDAGQISTKTSFPPVVNSGFPENAGDKLGDEHFGFWFGDLNFRLDAIPGDDIRRLLTLHTRGEYDVNKVKQEDSFEGDIVHVDGLSESSHGMSDWDSVSINSSTTATDRTPNTSPRSEDPGDMDDFEPDVHQDPTSLQATLDSLLPHDQLLQVMNQGKAFHDGWREGPITFLPSYKYDVGAVGLFDTSDKRRAPSWCDRILYRTRADKERHEVKLREVEEVRRRDEEMKKHGLDAPGDDVLFDYYPGSDDAEEQVQGTAGLDYDEYDDGSDHCGDQVVEKEGFVDKIQLHKYTSHQNVTSSDHKPVTSIFTLDYDAVVPELKTRVLAEVARDLDRAENEGRPSVTVVVDSETTTQAADMTNGGGLSDHMVDFGEVRYLRKASTSLTVANTGRVPATFSFVEAPTTSESGHDTANHWLSTCFVPTDVAHTDPETVNLGEDVTLEPGETVKAVLKIHVADPRHARMLNDGEHALEEVLVLRVTDGRDHFIPIRARWSPTCIGRSIDELIRVPDGGIRSFVHTLSQGKGWTAGTRCIPYHLPVQSAAPKELFKLTEATVALTERALADEQMLEHLKVPTRAEWPFDEASRQLMDMSPHAQHASNVIEMLDDDRPVMDAFAPETPSIERLEVVAGVLLLFLCSLTDGIITPPLWARVEQASLPSIGLGTLSPGQNPEEVVEDDKAAVLDILASAPNHNISFVFLMSTVAKMITELAPVSPADIEALKGQQVPAARGFGLLGRRPFGLVNLGAGGSFAAPSADVLMALEQRKAREKTFAEILSKAVCRTPLPGKEKERRLLEEHQAALVELFLRGKGEG